MSGSVDVLPVLDREIEQARKRVPFVHPEGPQSAEHQREYEEAGEVLAQLREVRAAVAELLEAATQVYDAERGEEQWTRLGLAILAVNGGAP